MPTREEKKRVFDTLHNPEGAAYQLAHARRPNASQEYDGEKLKQIYDRTVDGHVERAQGIRALLRTRKPRRRD
jgi:hypothetical protein